MEQRNKGNGLLAKGKIGIVLPNEDVLVKKKYEVPNRVLKSSKEKITEISFLTNKKTTVFNQIGICAGVFSMLILYVINSASVYYKNEKGIYILLGRAFIWKKNNVYCLGINKKMIFKSESLEYKLLFLKIFFEKKKGADIVITYKNKEIYEKIQKEIIIQLIFY